MCVIFRFSSQPAQVSADVSKSFFASILRIIAAPAFSNQSELTEFVTSADGVVRKCAHFSIYLVFGMFMYLFINEFDLKKIKPQYISVPIVFLYAVSDEIHQYFVPGRSCEFRDMMIDLSGAVIGTVLIMLIRRKKRRSNKA